MQILSSGSVLTFAKINQFLILLLDFYQSQQHIAGVPATLQIYMDSGSGVLAALWLVIETCTFYYKT